MKYILGFYSQISQYEDEEKKEWLLSKQIRLLLTYLYQNPKSKIMLRLGVGCFDWFEKKHPEINMLINDLCMKDQVELLASSYYDSILPMVPAQERSLHLEKTITYLRKRFHKKIKGLWVNSQIFTPSILSPMEQCGLEYLLISSYSQSQNSVLCTKPCYISEMGKQTVVFPFDDKYSKIVTDSLKTPDNSSKFIQEIKKQAELSNSCAISTIMFNLDQLVHIKDSENIYPLMFETLGTSCTTCSQYLEDHELTKEFYIPYGVYGRDLELGKANSINQLILEVPLLSRYSKTLDLCRDVLKDVKKNTDTRKNIEQALFKATDGSLFINKNHLEPTIRNATSRLLCDVEAQLSAQQLLPLKADIDGDRIPEFIATQKWSVAYLNSRGGVISRLNILPCKLDLCFNNTNGLFIDLIRHQATGKVTDLSSKRYDVTPLDKKGTDYFAKCPVFELNKNQINLTKHFKFRQNSITTDIEIENMSGALVKDYSYECLINLSFSNTANFCSSESPITDGVETELVTATDPVVPFKISVSFSKPVTAYSKLNELTGSNTQTNSKYQYTQLRIQSKLNLKPSQVEHLTITLKVEKQR